MKILFQGDSITDMGRDRSDSHNMGNGYPKYVKQLLTAKIGFEDAEFINLGISGDRTCDLLERRQKDCIDIQPDIVSILIGINDTWRRYDSNNPTSVQVFEDNYRKLLVDIKTNTKAKIIILEPFLIDSDENKRCYREDLYEKIEAVRRLAREYADAYVPLDGIFAAACLENEPSFYSADGVHPEPNGAKVIAEYYVKALKPLI